MECIQVNGGMCFIFKCEPLWTVDILKSSNQLIIHVSTYLKQTMRIEWKSTNNYPKDCIQLLLLYYYIPEFEPGMQPSTKTSVLEEKMARFFFVPKINTCSDWPTIAIEKLLAVHLMKKKYHFVYEWFIWMLRESAFNISDTAKQCQCWCLRTNWTIENWSERVQKEQTFVQVEPIQTEWINVPLLLENWKFWMDIFINNSAHSWATSAHSSDSWSSHRYILMNLQWNWEKKNNNNQNWNENGTVAHDSNCSIYLFVS